MSCILVRNQIGVSNRKSKVDGPMRCHEGYQELSEAEVVQNLDTMLRCLERGDFDPEAGRLVVIVLLAAWSRELSYSCHPT
jgi:hypothetical protein